MHGGCLGTRGDMWEHLGTPSDTWEQVGGRPRAHGDVRGRSLKSIRSLFMAEIAKNFSCLEETMLEV